jgi:hypothetical protein
MCTSLILNARLTATGLAFASLACMAQADGARVSSNELLYWASPPVISQNQSGTSMQRAWARAQPESGRPFPAAFPNSYRDVSMGDLLIEHFLGLEGGVSDATPSLRVRPTVQRDQIGVRLQIRF